MIPPPEPPNEAARLAALTRCDVLDTAPEERFDRLTRLGALALEAPICLVSLVDVCRQWFKSKVGLDADETPRDISFCGHAILEPTSLIVEDALLDPRFSDNPLVTGEPNIRFYAGRPLAAEDRPLMRSLFKGESVSGQTVGLRRQSGEVTWLSVNSKPIGIGDDGRPERAVLTIVDVTDRREVERIKNEFVSVVSHELRTPLTSIRGALGLLAGGQMGSMEPPAEQMLDVAVVNADRLIRLINDILDLERLESGGAPFECAAVPLGSLFDQVVGVMSAMADQVDVTLTVPSTDAVVWADADGVCQTVMNLVSNAIKFSPPGAHVRVDTEMGETDVLVRVKDEGARHPQGQVGKDLRSVRADRRCRHPREGWDRPRLGDM